MIHFFLEKVGTMESWDGWFVVRSYLVRKPSISYDWGSFHKEFRTSVLLGRCLDFCGIPKKSWDFGNFEMPKFSENFSLKKIDSR